MAILGQCKSWILGKDIFFQLDGFPGKKILFSLIFVFMDIIWIKLWFTNPKNYTVQRNI